MDPPCKRNAGTASAAPPPHNTRDTGGSRGCSKARVEWSGQHVTPAYVP
eukprot:COSAG01_NODE_16913_length_1195_cov_1.762557_1_plen_48_part_10